MTPSLAFEIASRWKPRKKTSHKGDFGRIFLLAGSRQYSGAAYLAGLAALRAGAGLVTVGVPETIHTIIARRQPELMVRAFPSTSKGALSFRGLKAILDFAQSQDILAIGPGLSQEQETQKLIRAVIRKSKIPLVIDADGLNALKSHLEILKFCETRAVLTPHSGEFLRVFGGKISDRDGDRKKRAGEAALKNKIILVLKGHHTVIANSKGIVTVNPTGNPGMAKGGSGDVLTGVIAALMGQKFSLWDAARFGVYLHGLAGDLAVKKIGEKSLIAGDILDFLPQAIQKILSK